MTVDLEHLNEADIDRLIESFGGIGAGAPCRQVVADRIVQRLYETFRVPGSGAPACVLVRCFQTSFYARLPLDYQHAANELLEQMQSHPNMRCLSLLATRGEKHLWNDVATSSRHLCIPLPSVEAVKRAPMIARLLKDFGVSVENLVGLDGMADGSPSPASGCFDIFHVEEAAGSPFVPAQAEFVGPYGVRSVVALGGLLGDGDLFAVILFTCVPLGSQAAAHLSAIGNVLREEMMPFGARSSFGRVSE